MYNVLYTMHGGSPTKEGSVATLKSPFIPLKLVPETWMIFFQCYGTYD